MSQFEISEMAEYIRKLDKTERTTIMELLGEEIKAQIILLNSFGDDEIGSKMTANYIAVYSGISAQQAMQALKEQAADNDNISL